MRLIGSYFFLQSSLASSFDSTPIFTPCATLHPIPPIPRAGRGPRPPSKAPLRLLIERQLCHRPQMPARLGEHLPSLLLAPRRDMPSPRVDPPTAPAPSTARRAAPLAPRAKVPASRSRRERSGGVVFFIMSAILARPSTPRHQRQFPRRRPTAPLFDTVEDRVDRPRGALAVAVAQEWLAGEGREACRDQRPLESSPDPAVGVKEGGRAGADGHRERTACACRTMSVLASAAAWSPARASASWPSGLV
jgi:hypothetical protein